MKVLTDSPMKLGCIYWGKSNPNRAIDILVDDMVIATEPMDYDEGYQFFEKYYEIPAELTKGKERVTVRFQPHEGNTVDSIAECGTFKL